MVTDHEVTTEVSNEITATLLQWLQLQHHSGTCYIEAGTTTGKRE